MKSTFLLLLAALLPASLWAQERSPPASARIQRANQLRKEKEKRRAAEQLEAFREAAGVLSSSTKIEDLVRASKVLATDYPASRPLLVETSVRGSTRARAFSLKLLGELGEGSDDLEVLARGLRDRIAMVRLAAVQAIKNFGVDGLPALERYLPHETVPNNRKMAVKAMESWQKHDVVPVLVHFLKTEKDGGVRYFMVSALEKRSGRKIGDNLPAWEAYLEEYELAMQRVQILRFLEAQERRSNGDDSEGTDGAEGDLR